MAQPNGTSTSGHADQALSGDAPHTTTNISLAPHPDDPMAQGLQALIAASPGVIVALITVWLADKFSRGREKEARDAAVAEAKRAEDVRKREAIRAEAADRRLDAIESLAKAATGMETDMDHYWDDPKAGYAKEPNYQVARALVHVYFPTRIDNEWSAFETAYRATKIAVAQFVLRRAERQERQTRIDRGHADFAGEQAAGESYLECRRALTDASAAFMARLRELAPELLN